MGNRFMLGVPLVIGLITFVWVAPRFFSRSNEVVSATDNPDPGSRSWSPTVEQDSESSPVRAGPQVSRQAPSVIIGARELVRVITPEREMEIVAKIDTGADYSSIDRNLARSLGIVPHRTEQKRVRNAEGMVKREVVTLRYRLAGREITSFATLADRSSMSTPMIIGKEDLAGFVVDVSRDFLTTPETLPRA